MLIIIVVCLPALVLALGSRISGNAERFDRDELRRVRNLADRARREQAFPFEVKQRLESIHE